MFLEKQKLRHFRKTCEVFQIKETELYQCVIDDSLLSVADSYILGIKNRHRTISTYPIQYRTQVVEYFEVLVPLVSVISKRLKINSAKRKKLLSNLFEFTFLFGLPTRIRNLKQTNNRFYKSKEYAALIALLNQAKKTYKIVRGFSKEEDINLLDCSDNLSIDGPVGGPNLEILFPIAEMDSAIKTFHEKIIRWKFFFRHIESKKSFQELINKVVGTIGDAHSEKLMYAYYSDLNLYFKAFHIQRKLAGIDAIPWKPSLTKTTLITYLERARLKNEILRPLGRPKKSTPPRR